MMMMIMMMLCDDITVLGRMLAEDIAKLMAMIPLDEEVRRQNDSDKIKVCL